MHDTRRLSWLRAGLLGANDGIISIAGLVVGVMAATSSAHVLLMTGSMGLLAGALSMGAGEYVSVSTQQDAEKQLNVPRNRRVSAWHAAWSSSSAFAVGGALPLSAALLSTASVVAFVSILALGIAGVISSYLNQISIPIPTLRIISIGLVTLGITNLIGSRFSIYL